MVSKSYLSARECVVRGKKLEQGRGKERERTEDLGFYFLFFLFPLPFSNFRLFIFGDGRVTTRFVFSDITDG